MATFKLFLIKPTKIKQLKATGRRRSLVLSLLVLASSAVVATSAVYAAPVVTKPVAAIPVVAIKAQQKNIHQPVQVSGSVTAAREASLSPAASGLVTQLLVEEGSPVKQGDLLLQLDDELASLQLQSINAQLKQARSNAQEAQRRLREAQQLAKQRSIAESTVKDLQAALTISQAALEQAQAESAYQQTLVKKHQILAPFDGVVSQKNTELGEWVSPSDGILQLVANTQTRLDFALAEDFLPLLTSNPSTLAANTSVQVHINALPDEKFQGRIATIVPVSSLGARTFLLRVELEKNDPRLVPGMSAVAQLNIPTQRNNTVVPRDAIVRHTDGRTVVWLVQTEDGQLQVSEQAVVLGQAFNGWVEVLSPLGDEAQVVIMGNESLQNGQPVRLIEGSSHRQYPSEPDTQVQSQLESKSH